MFVKNNFLILFSPRLILLTGGYLLAFLFYPITIVYLCFHLAAANASTATGYAISRGYGYVGERNGTVIRTSRFAAPPSYWGQLIVEDGLYRLID